MIAKGVMMLAKVKLDGSVHLSVSLLLSQISAAQDHFERTEGLMRVADARDKQVWNQEKLCFANARGATERAIASRGRASCEVEII